MPQIRYNDDEKFDIDLRYGKEFEGKFGEIFDPESKLEVKTERDWWRKTGNIAIEVSCRGRKSGLEVTGADYWVHILSNGSSKRDYTAALVFPVPVLKKIVKRYKYRTRNVGDGGKSRCVLVPLAELFAEVE